MQAVAAVLEQPGHPGWGRVVDRRGHSEPGRNGKPVMRASEWQANGHRSGVNPLQDRCQLVPRRLLHIKLCSLNHSFGPSIIPG